MVSKEFASDWDEFYVETPYTKLPWELGTPQDELIELIDGGILKPGKALDICSGAGTQSIYMALKGFGVVGIEISGRAIQYALEKKKDSGADCSFIKGDTVFLPFRDRVFDFVFDRGCFHHIPVKERDIYIRGVHRVLKGNGFYHMTCFSDKNGPGDNHFSRKQIVHYFSKYFHFNKLKPVSFQDQTGIVRYFYAVLMNKKIPVQGV